MIGMSCEAKKLTFNNQHIQQFSSIKSMDFICKAYEIDVGVKGSQRKWIENVENSSSLDR